MRRRRLLQFSASSALPVFLRLSRASFAPSSVALQFDRPMFIYGHFPSNGIYADLGMNLAVDHFGTALKRPLAYTVLNTEGKPATVLRKVEEAKQQQGTRFLPAHFVLRVTGHRQGIREGRRPAHNTAGADEITSQDIGGR